MITAQARVEVRLIVKRQKERFLDIETRIAWMEMYLMLPLVGVKQAFPNTAACQRRVAEVRWPSGVKCPSCGGSSVGEIESRSLYQCRPCRSQFSVTAGSIMHRTRLDLRMWFIAASDVITAYAYAREEGQLTGHRLADRYGISYVAAYRLNAALVTDLRQPGNLLKTCICTEELPVTRGPLQSLDSWYQTLWSVND